MFIIYFCLTNRFYLLYMSPAIFAKPLRAFFWPSSDILAFKVHWSHLSHAIISENSLSFPQFLHRSLLSGIAGLRLYSISDGLVT